MRIVGNYAVASVSADGHRFEILAKVDTGADSTSIDARDIEEFTRDDEEWVRFEAPTGEDDERVEIEVAIVDRVTIVGAGDDREERLVVEMDICVGSLSLETEVNLADREGLDYRLLIGREFLVEGRFLVNPAQSREIEPACEDDKDG